MIDFGNTAEDILDLFRNETSNLDLFFLKLSAYYSTALHPRKSLIVFDEVQQFPGARQLFKYLVADGRYDYIETGSLIRQCFENKLPLGQSLHRKVMNDFRQYVLVGGMPQSILAFLDEKSFEKSDIVKRRILNLYREDVAKFAAGYEDKVYAIFDGIPGQLTKKEKKYKLDINEGMLMENVVSQSLRYNGHRLIFLIPQ